jgi:hypothetical protein
LIQLSELQLLALTLNVHPFKLLCVPAIQWWSNPTPSHLWTSYALKKKFFLSMPWKHIYGKQRYRLHSFLTSPLNGGEWLTSHPHCFIPGMKCSTHYMEDYISPRTGLDISDKRKIPCLH